VRVGIFGGTFDPPHVGHLILAAEACDQMGLDLVLWVVTPDPPHKAGRTITPLLTRLDLVKAAICQESQFEISRVEIDRAGPHYSADTVEILARTYPQAELFYLMGGDSLHDLPTWKRPRQFIAALDGIGVLRRPGYSVNLLRLEQVLPGITEKVHFFDTPLVEISSSSIRERAAAGKHFRYFLPELVFQLIQTVGLYHANERVVD
jgi:nicotinate-nucleotide adenylyltransferase